MAVTDVGGLFGHSEFTSMIYHDLQNSKTRHHSPQEDPASHAHPSSLSI